jgi:cytochrome c-type biogenesis protein CcmE
MSDRKKLIVQIGVTVAVICGAVGFLLFSGIASGEVYKHVDEVMANPTAWQGKRLQVHGRVVKGSIEQRLVGNQTEYKFQIQNNGKVIDAHYLGIVPDTFKDDSEVVCKGKLTPAGGLEVVPDGVMAKCPSKYDAKKQPGNT